MSGDSAAIAANLFHAGNTCPFCQGPIAEGQMIVRCPACGGLHHESCWLSHGRCASYHCDERVRADAEALTPELVLTAEEVERVQPPPKRARPDSAETARRYLPKKPKRRSILAIVALGVAGLAVLGLPAVLAESADWLVPGIAAGMVAVILGVLALVLIHRGRKVYGSVPAGLAILVGGAMVLVYFFGLQWRLHRDHVSGLADFQLAERRPSEEELAALPPATAAALRANVVVTSAAGGMLAYGAQMTSGSGVVLRVEGTTAYVLTNRHVLGLEDEDDASAANRRIQVLFYNGEEGPAEVWWLAPDGVDLAVLTCQALTLEKLGPIELRQSLVPQGQDVFAVGNPDNLYWSYTKGVISGVRLQQKGGRQLETYQTQTPINYGNSGGGLYDMMGRLIGVNTWTRSKAAFEGLSFALSSRTVLELFRQSEKADFLASPQSDDDTETPDASEPADDPEPPVRLQ